MARSLYTTVVDAPFGRVRISSGNPMPVFVNGTYMGATGDDSGYSHNTPLETSATAVRPPVQPLTPPVGASLHRPFVDGMPHPVHLYHPPEPLHPSIPGLAQIHRLHASSQSQRALQDIRRQSHRRPAQCESGVARSSCSGPPGNVKRRSTSADDENRLKKQKTEPAVICPNAPGPSRALPLPAQPPRASVAAGTTGLALQGSVGPSSPLVPVYETCDEVRRKINKHLLLTPGLTQAQFCRDLFAMLRGTKYTGLQSKQLNDFRNKNGPRAGCSSSVFYAAYVFFETARIAEGTPKSQHRLAMEYIWARHGGFDLKHDGRHG